jgi:hypothetical protein
MTTRVLESLDRRVLGAVRFVDAVTRRRVEDALHPRASGVRFIRNRPGDYVMLEAAGFGAHTSSFEPPVSPPAPGSVPVTVEVRDPAGRYLSRQATVHLGLDVDPGNAGVHDGTSLFDVIEVPLFRSPAAPTLPGWAVIRATLEGPGANGVRGGVLLRVVRTSDGLLLGSGMTDERGEALVAVAGIPVTTFGSDTGPVLATSVTVVVEVVADGEAGELPDPADLEARHAALLVRTSPEVVLASGRVVVAPV